MSHQTFNDLWGECIQELTEQAQIENLSAQAQEQGQLYDPGFEHHSLLYIKYMQIAKKLEICYDQMVHPQKRDYIRGILETTIVRILELKEQLIFFNKRAKNPIVPFDEVLTDLKLKPETVDWQVPRYFTDDPDEADRIEKQQKLIKYYMEKYNLPDALDDLTDKNDPFEVELAMDRDTAIRIIQKNERGRTGIVRAQNVAEWHMRMRKEAQRKEERAKKPQEEKDPIDAQVFAATMIASHWKQRTSRKRFLRLREEEFQFLGMSAPPPLEVDHVKLVEEIRMKRKQAQADAQNELKDTMEGARKWVRDKQGPDIRAQRLRFCRQRTLQKTEQERRYPPKFPATLEALYAEDTPGAEEDAKGGAKDAKADPKGKAEEEGDAHLVGTTLTVQQIEEFVDEYHEKWDDTDQGNFDQKPDVGRARKDVQADVEVEIYKEVDALISVELEHLRKMYEKGTAKKAKKAKPPKKPKPPKAKKWCTVMEANMTTEKKRRYVKDMVEKGFLKLIKPSKLDDFIGEFAYMGQVNRVEERYASAPSSQMVKSLIVEHCILPLASDSIRRRATKELTAKSLLLYGPRGTGKSMLARAIATEAGAAFLDISPSVIEGKYTGDKKQHETLLWHTMCVAEALSPSVVYIDNVEQVFKAQKKGKKAVGEDKDPPARIQKVLVNYMKTQIKVGPDSIGPDGTSQPRVLIIGVTSKPFEEGVNQENMYNAFDFKVWVSFPDCGSRTLLLRKFIESKGVQVDPVKLNLSALAIACDGHSAGSLRWTVDRVLTARRIQQLGVRPLQVAEFIGPLARTPACWPEQWAAFLDFDYRATGEKDRFEEMQRQAQKMETGADDPKKKK